MGTFCNRLCRPPKYGDTDRLDCPLIRLIRGRLSHCSRRFSAVRRSRSRCWRSKLTRVDRRSVARDNSVFGGRPKCNSKGETPITEFLVTWISSIMCRSVSCTLEKSGFNREAPERRLMVWMERTTSSQPRWSPTGKSIEKYFYLYKTLEITYS